MRLEKQFEQAMASLEANKEIAVSKADVLAAALSKTNIEIVGGDGNFFNTFSKTLSLGKKRLMVLWIKVALPKRTLRN